MRIFEVTFSNNLTLRYALRDTIVVRQWAEQVKQYTARDMHRVAENHRHGFATLAEFRWQAEALLENAAWLGLLPTDIKSVADLTQEALNRLHIHFADRTAGRTFDRCELREARYRITSVNVLVHWLEYELANQQGRQQYVFNLDFNHNVAQQAAMPSIPAESMVEFSPNMEFGSLHLHYTYVGRHFLEMFDADDHSAPAAHFRPQHHHNATCGLVFSESQDNALRRTRMREYYEARGGREFWPYEFHDPRMCIGFYQLGQLVDVDWFNTSAARSALRQSLSKAEVVSWQVSELPR